MAGGAIDGVRAERGRKGLQLAGWILGAAGLVGLYAAWFMSHEALAYYTWGYTGVSGLPLALQQADVFWAAVLSQLINTIAFPLLLALGAPLLGLTAGYAAFVVIFNWLSLFVGVAACLASPMVLLGEGGFSVFALVWMGLFLAQLFIIWRAARMTLSPEYSVALMVVVLSVGVGVAAEQGGGYLARLLT